MLFFLQPDDCVFDFFLKALSAHQDNIHGHSVMLQLNTCFIVRSRDKAATKLSMGPSVFFSPWPLLYLEPTGDHRGKHHLGESFPSCKSTIIAIGMEAALHWGLDAFYKCCVTTKTEQWCSKQLPQNVCSSSDLPTLVQPGNPAPMCHL